MLKALGAAVIGVAACGVLAVAGLGRTEAFPSPAPVAAFVEAGSPPLAISDRRLVQVDPLTLAPEGRRIDAGSGGCASRGGGEACWSIPPWSFSPGASRLVLARNGRFALRSLRFVEVRGLRVAGDMRLPGGPVGALAWFAGGRLLALQEVCCSERQRLLAVDVAQRRVTVRRALPGSVLAVQQTPQELVLLLYRSQALGPARLAVADSRGHVRVVRLDRVVAGLPSGVGSGLPRRLSVPGLAVDPGRRRAFVVTPGLVTEVDLRSLAVSYHRLGHTSLLGRLHAWIEPEAQAKEGSGPTRSARWLRGGLLAVTGADEQGPRSKPAGLMLVDTRSWRSKTIDESATELAVAGDLLLVTGGRTSGLTAYGIDGHRRFRALDGRQAWVEQIYRGRAYVGSFRPNGTQAPFRVVDLATGRTIREQALPLPWLLLDASSGWWGP
jgi:hypothetical protein